MHYTQAHLPVPTDRWDQATFNHNLPHGNDVYPPIQVPPNIDPNIVALTVAEYRKAAQDRVGRTPLHTLTYNLLAENYFNNQNMIQWCQRAVDFAEFLIVAQNNPPQTAAAKAAVKIYVGTLAVLGGQYPQVAQQLPPDVMQKLQVAGQELQDIFRDVQAFQAAGRRAPAPQPAYGGYQAPVYGGGQLPPITPTYGQSYGYVPPAPPRPNPNQYSVSGTYQSHGIQTAAPQPMTGSISSGPTSAGGRHIDPLPQAQPIESWSTGPTTTNKEAPQMNMAPPSYTEPSAQDTSNLPVPTSLDDIVIDPYHYLPAGTEVDALRPYDVIYNPGGVEIRPAHLTDWKWTKGDTQPYRSTYDPERYMAFLVKWPDGVVQEKIVELEPDMDYLKHETVEALRAAKFRPKGKVIPSFFKVVDNNQQARPVEEVKKELDEGLITTHELSPVILNVNLTASTDTENEVEARHLVIEELGLDEDDQQVPAHEYTSVRVHPLEIKDEAIERLYVLSKSKDLVELATGLQELLEEGLISQRSLDLLNTRLTLGINRTLKEHMALGNLSIDSYVDEIEELLDYLASKYGEELRTVLEGNAESFICKWMAIVEEENGEEDVPGRPLLAEMYNNFQVGWTSDQLGSLQLSSEPLLVSGATHPRIRKVLQAFLGRNHKAGRLRGYHMRVITADGVYLEVINGWLVSNSILLMKL